MLKISLTLYVVKPNKWSSFKRWYQEVSKMHHLLQSSPFQQFPHDFFGDGFGSPVGPYTAVQHHHQTSQCLNVLT